jgi:hypothetical protein
MEDLKPWALLRRATALLIGVAIIIYGLLHFGALRWAFVTLKDLLVSFDFGDSAAENLAAGLIDSAIDIVCITGLIAIANVVLHSFRIRSRRALIANQVYLDYEKIVETLQGLSGIKPSAKHKNDFLAFLLSKLRRKFDNLQSNAVLMPEVSSVATMRVFEEAMEAAEYFYNFAQKVENWNDRKDGSIRPGAPVSFYVGKEGDDDGYNPFLDLHGKLLSFLKTSNAPADVVTKMKGSVGKSMTDMSKSARTFIVVKTDASK